MMTKSNYIEMIKDKLEVLNQKQIPNLSRLEKIILDDIYQILIDFEELSTNKAGKKLEHVQTRYQQVTGITLTAL